MKPGLRNTLAALAGMFAAGLSIAAIQAVNGLLFPPPPGFDPSDPEQVAAMMEQIPLAALIIVELSYAVGSFLGGVVIAKLAASRRQLLAAVIGGLLTLAGFANLLALPHPLWFAILSTITYVPMALLGARLLEPPGAIDTRARQG